MYQLTTGNTIVRLSDNAFIPPYSTIQCRRADIVEKDGVEVGRTYHRHCRTPGEDVSDDCTELQAVATILTLAASDVVDVRSVGTSTIQADVSHTYFIGHLIG